MLDSSDELITNPAVSAPSPSSSSSFAVISQSSHSVVRSDPLPSSTGLSYLSSLSTPVETTTSSNFVALSIHSTSSPLPSLSAQFAPHGQQSLKLNHDLYHKLSARHTMTVTPVPDTNYSSENSVPKSIVADGRTFHASRPVPHSVMPDHVTSSKPSNVVSDSSSPSSIAISTARPHKSSLSRMSDKPVSTAVMKSSSRLALMSRVGPSIRLPKGLRLSRPNRLIIAWFILILFITITLAIRYIPISPSNIPSSVSHFIVVSGYQVWFTTKRHARRFLHYYQRLLHIYPLASRAISAGIIFFFADLIAQFLNRPKQTPFSSTYSFGRNIRYCAYGLLLMGPLLYVWYSLMHRYGPPDTLRGSIQKALIENFTLEPGCIVIYVVYDAIVYRRPFSYVKRTIRTRLFPVWVNQCMFWFPANFSNYYIGTPDMRVIFSNLCSLLWNIYFSAKASRWSSSSQAPGHAPTSSSNTKPIPV